MILKIILSVSCIHSGSESVISFLCHPFHCSSCSPYFDHFGLPGGIDCWTSHWPRACFQWLVQRQRMVFPTTTNTLYISTALAPKSGSSGIIIIDCWSPRTLGYLRIATDCSEAGLGFSSPLLQQGQCGLPLRSLLTCTHHCTEGHLGTRLHSLTNARWSTMRMYRMGYIIDIMGV